MKKQWFLSKTLWVAFLAGVAGTIQAATGHVWFSPEAQILVITTANIVLRFLTKDKIGIVDDTVDDTVKAVE